MQKKFILFFLCAISIFAENRPEIVWEHQCKSDNIYKPIPVFTAENEEYLVNINRGTDLNSGFGSPKRITQYTIFNKSKNLVSSFQDTASDFNVRYMEIGQDTLFCYGMLNIDMQYSEPVLKLIDFEGNDLRTVRGSEEKLYRGSNKFYDGFFLYGIDSYSGVFAFDKYDYEMNLVHSANLKLTNIENQIDLTAIYYGEALDSGAVFAFYGPKINIQYAKYSVLIAFDKQGNKRWEKLYDFPGFDSTQIVSTKRTKDNTFLILVKCIRNNGNDIEWKLEKMDAQGNTLNEFTTDEIGSKNVPPNFDEVSSGLYFLFWGFKYIEGDKYNWLRVNDKQSQKTSTYYWCDSSNSRLFLASETEQYLLLSASYDRYSSILYKIIPDFSDISNSRLDDFMPMIYPNPVYGQISIDLSQLRINTKADILITDITGKSVFKTKASFEESLFIDTGKWTKGQYIVQISEGKNILAILKFVKL